MNTPASSNIASSIQQKHNSQNNRYHEQFKSMDKLQSMFSALSNLKQNLSTLTLEAFRGKHNMLSRNCSSCNSVQHTLKLCTSCLARMNVKCAQSMEVLRTLIAHYVRNSTNNFEDSENEHFSVSVRRLLQMLTETLPNVLRVPELGQYFDPLARKVASADMSCSTCNFEVKSVMINVQQLLLVLSVSDNSREYVELIEHLVTCLLETKFSCDVDSEYTRSVAENTTLYEEISDSIFINVNGANSTGRVSESESKRSNDSIDSNINVSQLKSSVNYDYLKLTHIQSLSQSNNSVAETAVQNLSKSKSFDSEIAIERHSQSDNYVATNRNQSSSQSREDIAEIEICKENNKKLPNSFPSEDETATRVKKLIRNMKLPKVWRSLDSIINPRRLAQVQNVTQDMCRPTCDQNKVVISNKVNETAPSAFIKNLQNHLSARNYFDGSRGNMSDSNDASTPSFSRCPERNKNSTKSTKSKTLIFFFRIFPLHLIFVDLRNKSSLY